MSDTLPSYADELVEDIVSQLPGATPDFVARELAATARDALPTAQTWVHDFYIDVVPGEGRYALDTGIPNTRVTTLLAVSWGCSQPLMPARSAFPMHCAGTPTHFWTPQPGQLLLHPTPYVVAEDYLGVRAVLVPTRSIDVVPEPVLEAMRDLLLLGAMARLQNMPSKPWTQATLAARNFRLYRSKLMRMKAEQARSLHPLGARAWAFPGTATARRGTPGFPNGGCCEGEIPPVVVVPPPATRPAISVSDAVLTDADPGPDPTAGITLSATSLTFAAEVGTPVTKTVRITNTGTGPLVVSAITVT